MKKIIFTIFLIFQCLVFVFKCYCQWNMQISGTTSILEDVQFINANTGWICGGGIILKTTNAGTNWITQTQPATNKTLDDIYVVDSNVAYCVGYFETILKTTNGGTNWFAIRNGPWGDGKSYQAVYFLNQNTGWICGNGSYILKTTNGGLNFDSTYIFWGYLNDMFMKDSLNGLICGDASGLFKTSNGGLNWLNIELPNAGILGNLNKINVIETNYVWVVGSDNKVFHSTDFGSTWDTIGRVVGSDVEYCSFFSSRNTGWVGGTYGRLFKSTNGGLNWINQNLSTAYQRAIVFIDDYTGWTVGGGGRILHTTTGGVTAISNNNVVIADDYYLEQNFPNPFNAGTLIRYILSKQAFVELSVFDINGRKIRTLVSRYQNPGKYDFIFKADDLSSGIYFYRLTVGDEKPLSKEMIVIK